MFDGGNETLGFMRAFLCDFLMLCPYQNCLAIALSPRF